MSTWNLGIDDVSEETRAFKDKLVSKDAQIAAQNDKLARQAAELDEMRESLHETLYKLTTESQRALQLENDLQQRSEDLRNERILSENIKATLSSVQEGKKSTTLEIRQLESTLERISHTSDEHNARAAKAEKEKAMLDARVKELEENIRQLSQGGPSSIPVKRGGPSRPRSSSLSGFRMTTLEQELLEARTSLAKKETEMKTLTQKLAQVQQDLIKADNDKSTVEKRWKSDVHSLQASLDDKVEELAYLREQQGDGSREDELLKRIEEDEAKIAALEMMLRGTESTTHLKDQLQRVEYRLKEEHKRLTECQKHCAVLEQEKEEALDDLDKAREEARILAHEVHERNAREHEVRKRARKSLATCDNPLMDDDSCLINMDTLEPSSVPLPPSPIPQSESAEPDMDTIAHIERLLNAIERLRGERDTLRRDVQFLESEAKFTIEALEAKLAASTMSRSTASNTNEHTMATIEQLRGEMDEMHAQFVSATDAMTESLRSKNLSIKSLRLKVEGLIVTCGHISSESDKKLQEISLELEAMTNDRNDIYERLRYRDDEWQEAVESLRIDEQEARERLEQAMCEIAELNNHLDNLESERDSLTLQVTNLTSDLQIAQDELANAESRYTNLQFHQLNDMTSNQATRTLRDHIAELEGRVMRRNETIGILQHDVRRLDTNLRLQEERLVEMTSELEMITAQKDAMVEDCADAREARDEAISRVETLEEEMENLEARAMDDQTVISGLIIVVTDTVARARYAITVSKNQARSTSKADQLALQQQLNENIQTVMQLTRESEEYSGELKKTQLALEQCQDEVRELSQISQDLQAERSILEAKLSAFEEQNYQGIISDLQKANRELQDRFNNLRSKEAETPNFAQLELQHPEPLDALQKRLAETEAMLDELRKNQISSKDDLVKKSEENALLISDLQQQLESTKKDLADYHDIKKQLEDMEDAHAEELVGLQDELQKISEERKEALKLHDELEDAKTKLETSSASERREFEKKIQSLQGRFEEEIRLSNLSKEEVTQLTLRLQEEVDGRAQDFQEYNEALEASEERFNKITNDLAALRDTLAVAQEKLAVREREFCEAEEVKTALQEQITTLEAEIQKSKSLQRYLESQLRDSNGSLNTMKADIERLQSELVKSETSRKTAEVNLGLINAQHQRETKFLQSRLDAFSKQPDLEEAVRQLEERNNEMDELLRAKCAEIEENDDRVLEMLKEKKKLQSKVESLNRKVLNLQAKLAAAKASTAAPSAPEIQPVPQSKSLEVISASSSTTPQGMDRAFSRPRSATATSSASRLSVDTVVGSSRHQPLTRVISGPSSIPRPKTPERSRPITPVFKARTPEARLVQETVPLPTAVVIGKKRAAPDDFEACEDLPAQAFSADGEDIENKTPRVRRMLNSLQSGFTPVRHQNNRPTIGMPSPRRSVASTRTSPQISDLTNSPFQPPPQLIPGPSAKSSNKRSWLGKIRGQP